jgi:hypothetical protein
MTNAGPDSDQKYHYVIVDFMSYSSAASGARGDAKKSAAWLRKEPLRIECDCGRWRYWYRYIATIGKFNAGRDETGFPKIRNPNLRGVACKHILRVMAEVESSPSVQNFLARLIDKARARDDNRVRVETKQKEAEKMVGQARSPVEVQLYRGVMERVGLVRTAMRDAKPSARKAAPFSRRAEKSGGILSSLFNMAVEKISGLFKRR